MRIGKYIKEEIQMSNQHEKMFCFGSSQGKEN